MGNVLGGYRAFGMVESRSGGGLEHQKRKKGAVAPLESVRKMQPHHWRVEERCNRTIGEWKKGAAAPLEGVRKVHPHHWRW